MEIIAWSGRALPSHLKRFMLTTNSVLVAPPQFAKEVVQSSLERRKFVSWALGGSKATKRKGDDEEADSRCRISTSVIETVKRGWSDRLPEYDYLASILSQVERKQKLTLGMVKPAHPVPVVQLLKVTSSQHRIHLGKIDVFTGGSSMVLRSTSDWGNW